MKTQQDLPRVLHFVDVHVHTLFPGKICATLFEVLGCCVQRSWLSMMMTLQMKEPQFRELQMKKPQNEKGEEETGV